MLPIKQTPIDITIKQRTIHFNCPRAFRQYWIAENAFECHFFNLNSVFIKMTEAFGMHTVRAAKDKLTDPHQKTIAEQFIRQEAEHTRLHDKLNEALQKWGYARIYDIIEGHRIAFKMYLDIHQNLDRSLRFAAMLEHIAGFCLRRFSQLIESDYQSLEPQMALLFGYHATEELEHKGVCFDIYTSLYGHMPNQHPKFLQEWEEFNRITLKNFERALLYFMMMDKVIQGELANIDREALHQRLFNSDDLFSLNSEYFKFGQQGFHPWDTDDRFYIDRWDSHWAQYFKSRCSNAITN